MSILAVGRRRSGIPAGLIIFFNDTSVPSGWERFTSADSRHIVGAGDTYTVGETGGTATASISEDSSVNGAHTNSGDTFFAIDNAAGTPDTDTTETPVSAGDHDHTITANYTRPYRQLVMIKATQVHEEFPANGIVLSDGGTTPVSGLSICYDDNILVRSGATITTSAGGFSGEDCSSAGGHFHGSDGTSRATGEANTGYHDDLAGAHSDHSVTPALEDWELKRIYLTAWTAVAAFANDTDVIAMWEGSTAPQGWELATEIQNYFVMLSDVGNAGDTYDETNRIQTSFVIGNSNNTHDHRTDTETDTLTTTGYHYEGDNVHNHTVATAWTNHTPAYYALTFIRKL